MCKRDQWNKKKELPVTDQSKSNNILSHARVLLQNFSKVKIICTHGYSVQHFPAFGLNSEREDSAFGLRIQSKCGKMQTRITLNTDTSHAVSKCAKQQCRCCFPYGFDWLIIKGKGMIFNENKGGFYQLYSGLAKSSVFSSDFLKEFSYHD